MRAIYTAPTVAAASDLLKAFSDEWAEKCPAMIRAWENAWDEFTPFLAFATEIRKIVYTTNSIESLNARFRRAVRHRGHLPHRASSNESPVSSGNSQEEKSIESERPNQRMETHPQHTYHALRRPHRPTRQMTPSHVIYTTNVTVPWPAGPKVPNHPRTRRWRNTDMGSLIRCPHQDEGGAKTRETSGVRRSDGAGSMREHEVRRHPT
ncbi:MAG: transposase [Acidimicrobiia bacterium]|nr:transposase [Acidimicrobiia bacterium]